MFQKKKKNKISFLRKMTKSGNILNIKNIRKSNVIKNMLNFKELFNKKEKQKYIINFRKKIKKCLSFNKNFSNPISKKSKIKMIFILNLVIFIKII